MSVRLRIGKLVTTTRTLNIIAQTPSVVVIDGQQTTVKVDITALGRFTISIESGTVRLQGEGDNSFDVHADDWPRWEKCKKVEIKTDVVYVEWSE